MKHTYRSALLLVGVCAFHAAFSQATETTAGFQGGRYPAFTTEYRFTPDVVTAAIRRRLTEDKIKTREKKEVISSEGIHYDVLTPQTIDLYFEVEGMGKKGKDGTTVNMFVSKGKDNFTNSAKDPELARNAIGYLDALRHYIALYDIRQQIGEQEKNIDREAKSYKKLLKNTQKAESRRYDLQGSLGKETDPGKQDKLRKKMDKLNKDIYRKQQDIDQSRSRLQQLKDKLNLLQNQLDRENEHNS